MNPCCEYCILWRSMSMSIAGSEVDGCSLQQHTNGTQCHVQWVLLVIGINYQSYRCAGCTHVGGGHVCVCVWLIITCVCAHAYPPWCIAQLLPHHHTISMEHKISSTLTWCGRMLYNTHAHHGHMVQLIINSVSYTYDSVSYTACGSFLHYVYLLVCICYICTCLVRR